MAKLRIYELAKELGVENKVILDKAQELGMSGKKSHSNSLDPDEVEKIRRSLLKDAIEGQPTLETKTVTTRVSHDTGESRTVVERRKGNIIRRRKSSDASSASTEPELAETDAVTEVADNVETQGLEREEEHSTEQDELTAEQGDVITEAAEIESEEPVAEEQPDTNEQLEAEKSVKAEEATEEVAATPAEEDKKVGPKILGRIQLPQQSTTPSNKKKSDGGTGRSFTNRTANAFSGSDTDEEDDDDSRGKKKGAGNKRRAKKREFTRSDLVDYEGRAPRKSPKGKAKKGEDDDSQSMSDAVSAKPVRRVVKIDEFITVGDLAHQMSLKAGEVITKLIDLGIMATINQALDFDTASIVAEEFGAEIESTSFNEESFLENEPVDPEKLQERPPIVTVMGHVDHGKTSLLDAIRKTSVVTREHGGITQHIGAYSVATGSGKKLAFIDTPGHAAFTAMRARGANITDIVILVVAADDGVMPQTLEAMDHAKAAGVPIVVAVNKMDKPSANPDKVKQQLAERGLQPEEWGGDVMFFPVSALQGEGIDSLLEGVLLQAEVKELRADPTRSATGRVIEARQEKGRGTVATILVQNGTLRIGDIFIAGSEYGRVRSMVDHNGESVNEAGPSTPVEISGFTGSPSAGDDFIIVDSEGKARQVTQNRAEKIRVREVGAAAGPISLEEFAKMGGKSAARELNVIIKADVQGSLEAVRDSLERTSTEKVKVRTLHGGVGGVNETDVQLAIASSAIIVAFNVRAEPRAMSEAEGNGVDVRFYRVIYELIDDVKKAMAGLLDPEKREKSLGRAEVRDTFVVPKSGTIAGCYVQDGQIKRGAFLRLLRDSAVVYEGRLGSLRRFKDDVKEVQSGYECGIGIEGFNDIKPGDTIEAYEIEEFAASLE